MSNSTDDKDLQEETGFRDGVTRYKYMPSALKPSSQRGLYLKFMEKLTPDASIPFFRFIVSLFGMFAAVILLGKYVLDIPLRAPYVVAPVLILMVAIILIILVYMISSRDGSMLSSTFTLNLNNIIECRREKKNLHLESFGIKKINKTTGEITFNNGDKGALYLVKGMLSKSTLPQAADYISGSRLEYEIGRTPDSQEIRITTISPNKLYSQIDDLDRIAKIGVREGNEQGSWRRTMALAQKKYLNMLIENGSQLTMIQAVIIRDSDRNQLNRSIQNFERYAHGNMYERCRRVVEIDEIRDVLGACVLDEGVKKIG